MRFRLYLPALASVVLGFFILGLYSFEAFIYSVFFLMPFEWTGSFAVNPAPENSVGTIIRWIQLAFIGGGAAFLVNILRKKNKLTPSRPLFFLGLFCFSVLFSALLINHARVYQILLYLGLVVLVFFVISQAVKKRHLLGVEKAIIISTLITIGYGIYQFVADSLGVSYKYTGLLPWYTAKASLGLTRIQSVSREPLYYGSFLLIPLILFYTKFLNEPDRKKSNRYLMLVGLVVLALFLTLSRGAIFAGFAGMLVVSFVYLKKLKLKLNGMIKLVLALLLVIFVFVGVVSYKKRELPLVFVNKYFNQLVVEVFKGRQESVSKRKEMRELGLTAFRENPIFGVGLGGLGPWFSEGDTSNNWFVTLNMPISLLAEVGLIGVLLFASFILSVYRGALRAAKRAGPEIKTWLVASLVIYGAFWIQYQSFSYFFFTQVWMILGLIAALTAMANGD